MAFVVLSACLSCSDDTVAPSQSTPSYRASVDGSPSWSPNGETIAYRRSIFSSQGPPGIYLIRPDGSDNQLILDERPFYNATLALLNEIRFSPDALSLALAINGEIFILDLESHVLRQLTYTGAKAFQPDWAPDGRQLVYRRRFSSPEIDSSGIYVVDITTGIEHPLRTPSEPIFGEHPRWSPQGEPIVFSLARGGYPDIYALSSDGSAFTRLTNSGLDAWAEIPHWIDAGRRVLYAWRRTSDATSLETRVMDADGSHQMRWPVTLSLQTLISDAISPDARWVIVPGLPPSSTDSLAVLFLRGLDDSAGTTLRQLTFYRPPAEHSSESR
jgi:Tol biopolymer transport system component